MRGAIGGARASPWWSSPSADGWVDLLPSQHVRADVRLAPARPGDVSAALLVARGPPRSVGPPSRLQRVAGVLRAGSAARGRTRCRRPSGGCSPASSSVTRPRCRRTWSPTSVRRADPPRRRQRGQRGDRPRRRAAGRPLVRAAGPRRPRGRAAGRPRLPRARPPRAVGAPGHRLRGGRGRGAGPWRPGGRHPRAVRRVVVLLLADPGLGRSYGFALSVLATAGLLVVAPGWRRSLARWMPPVLADALAVPAAAQVVCAPVIVMLAGNVSLVSVPANLLVAPAVAPATVLGVLTALVAPVSPALAQLRRLPRVGARGLDRGRGPGVGPGAGRRPSGGRPGCAARCLLAGSGGSSAWWWGPAPAPTPRRLAAGLAVAPAARRVAARVRAPRGRPRSTRAVFCDVGQGDAVVVPTAPGHALLVDAGPDPDAVDRCLSDLGIARWTRWCSRHLHADHVEGLPGALRGRSVGEILVGPLDEPPEEAERVQGWAAAAGVPLRRVVVGERREVRAPSGGRCSGRRASSTARARTRTTPASCWWSTPVACGCC